MGFKEMTSVQQAVIPALLRGHDALVKSQTGSGTLSVARNTDLFFSVYHLIMSSRVTYNL